MIIKAVSCAISSIFLAVIAWFSKFSVQDLDIFVKVVTGLGSVVTAFFASRYYVIAARQKKKK